MNQFHRTFRPLAASEIDCTAEAMLVQSRAARREPSVIRVGALLFFSTGSGDAWMLDAQDGETACLASGGAPRPIPIVETSAKVGIAWSARFRLEGDAFVVIAEEGETRAYRDYPVGEIRRMLAAKPAEGAGLRATDPAEARERLRRFGRNDPCPCGSGRKYKKCCLPFDEATRASASPDAPPAEKRSTLAPPRPGALGPSAVDEPFALEAPSHSRSAGREAPRPDYEPALPPETLAAARRIWAEFDRLAQPTAAQLDALLDRLLALPPESTDWAEGFDAFAEKHPDVPSVFRRIASALPPTKGAGASYFYWRAMERLVPRGNGDLVPEIASAFRRLDRTSYNPDAMHHVMMWALAAGYDAEALALEEHFLPIRRDDPDLLPGVVLSACRSIFELRVGRRLPELGEAKDEVEALAHEFRRDIEGEMGPVYPRFAARVLRGEVSTPEFRRETFSLTVLPEPEPDETEEDGASPLALRHCELLLRIAHEAWRHRGRSPVCN